MSKTLYGKFSNKRLKTLDHGKKFKPRAMEAYVDAVKLKLKQYIFVRKTGIIIQPSLI